METTFKTTVLEGQMDGASVLTGKDRIILTDTRNAVKLNKATATESLKILVKGWGRLRVEDTSGEKETYELTVLIDEEGNKYTTGSDAFYNQFATISTQLVDAGEGICGNTISVYQMDSKNHTGKKFLTCSLV